LPKLTGGTLASQRFEKLISAELIEDELAEENFVADRGRLVYGGEAKAQ
jgi:hypothetical protein